MLVYEEGDEQIEVVTNGSKHEGEEYTLPEGSSSKLVKAKAQRRFFGKRQHKIRIPRGTSRKETQTQVENSANTSKGGRLDSSSSVVSTASRAQRGGAFHVENRLTRMKTGTS